jgi:hypothetical protein
MFSINKCRIFSLEYDSRVSKGEGQTAMSVWRPHLCHLLRHKGAIKTFPDYKKPLKNAFYQQFPTIFCRTWEHSMLGNLSNRYFDEKICQFIHYYDVIGENLLKFRCRNDPFKCREKAKPLCRCGDLICATYNVTKGRFNVKGIFRYILMEKN